jgi:glycerol-3-phosphate acyltransferase PlsY
MLSLVFILACAFLLGAAPVKKGITWVTQHTQLGKISAGDPAKTRSHFVWSAWVSPLFSLVLVLRGYIMMLIVSNIYATDAWEVALTGICLLLGECYSPWDKKRTGLGMFMGICLAFIPQALIVILLAYVVILVFVHYRIVAFLMAMAAGPILLSSNNNPLPLIFVLVSIIVIVLKNKPAIVRYMEKKELTLLEELHGLKR